MRWFAEHAWLPDGLAHDVLLEATDGRFTSVAYDSAATDDAVRLPGVVFPGLANCHSHAFHRALRGRAQDGGGTFWTWRNAMYRLAERLDPDSYLALAQAVYAEMALAGVTCVGEFHYLHHGPGGVPYADPNAMAEALREAAAQAGIRLTLLDTCYLTGGLDGGGHFALEGVQLRFGDGDAERWAQRVALLQPSDGMRTGVAAHSVRAVPRSALSVVCEAGAGRPLHVHVSEQRAENEACDAFYRASPTALLKDAGALGPHTTAVHATHMRASDIAGLGGTGTSICLCPTTERDLADGIGPARRLREAGCDLIVGSDQHAVVDLFEEARAIEMGERVVSGERGCFTPDELTATMFGHAALGWPDAGRLEVGHRADLVAVRTDTVRTAGTDPALAIFAATAADIETVVVDGAVVVNAGHHRLGDIAEMTARSVAELWKD
jgi:formiminoglutamate deiminase